MTQQITGTFGQYRHADIFKAHKNLISTKYFWRIIVAIIAVTREILLLDMPKVGPTSEFTVTALIIALSIGYFLINRSETRGIGQEQRNKIH